jgi:hypothetical protein
LIFDSVVFLDEAESGWRRVLLRDMSRDSPKYGAYAKIADDCEMLMEYGALRRIDPQDLTTTRSMQVAVSTLADLSDDAFVKMASQPGKYGLPYRSLQSGDMKGRPTWQAFQNKIALPLRGDVEFRDNRLWRSHVLTPGDDVHSWSLSYEAGSATVVNYYLEASQELGLAPVTTSELHHRLVLRKVKRAFREGGDGVGLLDGEERQRCRAILEQGELLRLFGGIFPPQLLDRIRFSDIVEFRNETQEQRHAFLREIREVIRTVDGDCSQASYDRDVAKAVQEMGQRFRGLQGELLSARDRMIPSVADVGMYGVAGSGTIGALATFLGGLSSAGVVAASALTLGGALASKACGLWVDRRRLLRKEQPGVSYLLSVSKLGR